MKDQEDDTMENEQVMCGLASADANNVVEMITTGPSVAMVAEPVVDTVVGPAQQLDMLAAEINKLHERAAARAREAVVSAREAGEKLLAAKALVPHGAWQQWIDEHCQCSVRTAQKYMKIADGWLDLEGKAPSAALLDLTIDGAVGLLGRERRSSLPAPDTAGDVKTVATDTADADDTDTTADAEGTGTADADDTDITNAKVTDTADADDKDTADADTKRTFCAISNTINLGPLAYLRQHFGGKKPQPPPNLDDVSPTHAAQVWRYEVPCREEQNRRIEVARDKGLAFAGDQGSRVIITAFWVLVALGIIKIVGNDVYQWMGGEVSTIRTRNTFTSAIEQTVNDDVSDK